MRKAKIIVDENQIKRAVTEFFERSDTYYDPMKIKPKADWVLVLNDKRKGVTAGGIVLPEMELGVEKVANSSGRIIRLGGGDKIKTLELNVGDRIMYRGFLKFPNQIPTANRDDEYFLMSVDDIFAVLGEKVDVSIFSGAEEKN